MTIAAEAAGLESRFGRAGAVSFAASPLGGVLASLTARDGATAEVALRGGHILGFRTPAHGSVLWLSPLARLDDQRPVRGGIPVCWPWFGAHPDGGGRPSHGVARTAPWHVTASSGGDGAAPRLVLALDEQATRSGGLDLTASLEITLTDSLDVALTTRNVGHAPVRLTQALHSYFAVSDIANIAVSGLEGRPFIDQLDGGKIKTEAQPITFSSEVDRIYQEVAGPVHISDSGARRRIVITSTGSASAVVWNPWVAKGERLGDLGPDGYRRMVCVETANAGSDVVELMPGASHTLSARISVEASSRTRGWPGRRETARSAAVFR